MERGTASSDPRKHCHGENTPGDEEFFSALLKDRMKENKAELRMPAPKVPYSD
jgi:hypothetical protein